jgi:pyruvate, water dikinase
MTDADNQQYNTSTHIKPLKNISLVNTDTVGEKIARLGHISSVLGKSGITTPPGFAISVSLYEELLQESGIAKKIKKEVYDVYAGAQTIGNASKRIKALFNSVTMPAGFRKEVTNALHTLRQTSPGPIVLRPSVFVTHNKKHELYDHVESTLHIQSVDDVLSAIQKSLAQAFSVPAMKYRQEKNIDHMSVGVSFLVQHIVDASYGASGYVDTIDPETFFDGVGIVTSTYGLAINKTEVNTPDVHHVFKHGLLKGKESIIAQQLGSKKNKYIFGKTNGTQEDSVPQKKQNEYALSNKEVIQLATWGIEIEKLFGRAQHIQWVKDGSTNQLFILESRPIHAYKRTVTKFVRRGGGETLATGVIGSSGVGGGSVKIIETGKEKISQGDVVIISESFPELASVLHVASAVIIEHPSLLNQIVTTCRVLGIPCIVGATNIIDTAREKKRITVDCSSAEGKIFEGLLPYEMETLSVDDIQPTRMNVRAHLQDPEHAYRLPHLEKYGVGYIKESAIFAHVIGIHPFALLSYQSIKDSAVKAYIQEKTRGYKQKKEYFVQAFSEAIARVAVSAYPSTIVVQLENLHQDAYAYLPGMMDFSSAQLARLKKDRFKYECAAIKQVREDWGLTNVSVMLPPAETPSAAKEMKDLLAYYGLEQSVDFEIHAECSIPANIHMVGDFAKLFDGITISIDELERLQEDDDTQDVFSEKNKAVKDVIKKIVKTAHANDTTVSAYGEATTRHPEFVDFLVRSGIDELAIHPNVLIPTQNRVAVLENTVGKRGEKTHKSILSLVALWGVFAIGLVAIGAGCTGGNQITEIGDVTEGGVTPAEIRQRVEDRVLKQKEKEFDEHMTLLSVDDFAKFEIAYPGKWDVESWKGGITFSDPDTGEFVSVFKQLIGHPVSDDVKQKGFIDSFPAIRFKDLMPKDGKEFDVVEIEYDGKILEVSGKTDRFDDILMTLTFTSPTPTSNRAPTHWDIRERRFCQKIITYAKRSSGGLCEAFSSPCDVPKNYDVCDENDI